jgi:hypothetical protein
MVSAFRGVIALAADDAIAAFATPEPTTGLNDAPSNGPLGAAWCVSAFMSGTDRRRAALRLSGAARQGEHPTSEHLVPKYFRYRVLIHR